MQGTKKERIRIKDFDFTQDEFYDEVYALALQGARNTEIAIGLAEKFNLKLSPNTFETMARSAYKGWTEEENERFGERIHRQLFNARENINRIVRGRFLKLALGGMKVTSKTTVKRRLRIDGVLTDDEEVQTTENESELAPNLSALSTWLYQNDPVWRAKQRGEDEEDAEATQGIDITQWIDKEMGIYGSEN